jgi:hypothetical protein
MKAEVLIIAAAVLILLWWLVCKYQTRTMEGMVRVLDSSANESDVLEDFFRRLHDQGVGVKKVPVSEDGKDELIEGFRWRSRPWRQRQWWRYPFFYDPGYTYYPYWY